jgi:GR25 family glycosyltransferase involved in LPS biosynthesis
MLDTDLGTPHRKGVRGPPRKRRPSTTPLGFFVPAALFIALALFMYRRDCFPFGGPSRAASLPVYGINVPRRQDRRASFLSRFTGVTPIIIDAVDGSLMESMRNSSLTIGEHACFMSHVKALSTAIEDGHRQFLILEDDALLYFPQNFQDLDRILDAIPSDWGAVSLAANALPSTAVEIGPEIYTLGGSDLYGAQAIIYRKNWARKILDNAVSRPVAVPWDLWVSRALGDNLFVKYPSLAPPNDISDSDTLRSHLGNPTSFTDSYEFIQMSGVPIREDLGDGAFHLEATDPSCIKSVQRIFDDFRTGSDHQYPRVR